MSLSINEPLRWSRYILVVTPEKDVAIRVVRATCRDEISKEHVFVLLGDLHAKDEFFPTAQLLAQITRCFNRSFSAAHPDDRVRELAVVFFRHFPKDGRDAGAVIARREAARAGYHDDEVQVLAADTSEQLAALLLGLGVGPQASEAPPLTFVEAIGRFSEEYPEDARLADGVLESAGPWEYPNPSEILNDLRAVHRVYGRWVDQNGNPISASDRKRVLMEEATLNLKGEKPNVIKRWRTRIFPEMGDRKLTFPMHLAYNFRHTRIYFWFPSAATRDEEIVKTLVVHAGEHLPDGLLKKSDSG